MRRTILILAVVLSAIALFWATQDRVQAISLVGAKLVPIQDAPGTYAGYLSIENTGHADILRSAGSDVASVSIVGQGSIGNLVVPSGSALLSADGVHLRLSDVAADQAEGTAVPLLLMFEKAGEVRTRALISAPETMVHAAGHQIEAPQAASITLTRKGNIDGAGVSLNVHAVGVEFIRAADDAAHVPGQGHAHLYLNGMKLGRIYDDRIDLGLLPQGKYEVRLSLNANDHRQYAKDGTPLEDTLQFELR